MSTAALRAKELVESIRNEGGQLHSIVPDVPHYPLFREPDADIWKRISPQSDVELQFNPTAIDLLIQESSILLDRCLTERREKLELEVKALEFMLEQKLFFEINKVKLKQKDAGIFTVNKDVSVAKHEMSEKVLQIGEALAHAAVDASAARTQGNALYEQRIKLGGEVTKLSAYVKTGEIEQKARELADISVQYETLGVNIQNTTIKKEIIDLEYQNKINTIIRSFDEKNAKLLEQLYDTEVAWQSERRELASARGSALNYASRLLEVQQLFDFDLEAARQRLKSLRVGLLQIIGNCEPLPPKTDEGSLTALLLWARSRIEEWTRHLEYEIDCTMVFSLRQMLPAGGKKWEELIKGGQLFVTLDPVHFGNMNSIRIRQIKLFVASDEGAGFWYLRVTPPSQKWQRTEKGPSPREMHFGNVGSRKNESFRNTSSARSIMNIAPEGPWKFNISAISSNGVAREAIKDVEVEFVISAI